MPFVGGVWSDRSGAVEAGAVSQVLMPPNPRRIAWLVQNLSAEPLWIDFGVPAVVGRPSLRITPGGSYCEEVPGGVTSQEVNVTGPTTGQEFSAKEM